MLFLPQNRGELSKLSLLWLQADQIGYGNPLICPLPLVLTSPFPQTININNFTHQYLVDLT
jgi:hypothetical protein